MNISLLKDYLSLTKPRILFMVLITTAMGFFLGGIGIYSIPLFLYTLLGTGLASAGSSALNQQLEKEADRLMDRTLERPVPAGRISEKHAFIFGISFTLIGVTLLLIKVNFLTALLVLLTSVLYAYVYTPLKKLTWLNTLIGAIPGALPPVAGWTAATGQVDTGAWILFWILFLWQHPHFYAIAWIYKDDYAKGGFKMLPVVEPDGKRMFRQIIWHSFILIPVSLLPALFGHSGLIYFIGTLCLGLFYFSASILFVRTRTVESARNLLKASVIYLPLLLILIIADIGF